MPPVPAFTPDTFRFLAELALNNERGWFNANKARYEVLVREPALALIRALRPRLAKISPAFVADDRKVGGSLMRVHRDTRFGRDKTPYKTNIGIQFRHRVGKDVHAPGFYLHLANDEAFFGVGLWHPEPAALAAIREALLRDPKGWTRASRGTRFAARYALAGDSLKRPPRGVPADHPLVEDLRRKDFIATCPLSLDLATRADFAVQVAAHFALAKDFMAYLCKAQGLDF